jgi:transposase
MANRYRLYPTGEQAVFMRERHCTEARYRWNPAVEQFRYRERKERGTMHRPAPGTAARQKQLAEARQEFEWLRGRSSSVQQQALRDFDRAAQACFDGYRGEPTWRKRVQSEGFCIRDTKVTIATSDGHIYANCCGMFARRLGQKLKAPGTTLVAVSTRYSSQECRKCGHTAKANRESQAVFLCVACGHDDHADRNAAEIILARARPAHTPGPVAPPQGVTTARCARQSENSGWVA